LLIFVLALQRWQDTAKRREFFVDFAAENNFDPLIAEEWYKILPEALEDREVFFFLFFSDYTLLL
jgi:hypothetical protein